MTGKPTNEEARLEALRASNILDTEPDPAFDHLTRLARGMFDAEVALVSLVDEDRQWFKSTCGLDASETPRDISFCTHAVLAGELLMVPDATKDARFKDNPLVTGPPHIRFYCGAPLKTEEGLTIGTLCIVDSRKRKPLTKPEQQTLRDLAVQVMRLIREGKAGSKAA